MYVQIANKSLNRFSTRRTRTHQIFSGVPLVLRCDVAFGLFPMRPVRNSALASWLSVLCSARPCASASPSLASLPSSSSWTRRAPCPSHRIDYCVLLVERCLCACFCGWACETHSNTSVRPAYIFAKHLRVSARRFHRHFPQHTRSNQCA